jgi:hypothetical protein
LAVSTTESTTHTEENPQEYALRIIDTQHLILRDLNFFATTVWTASLGHSDTVKGITFDSLRFQFPSAQKRMLGEYEFHAPTTLFVRNTTEWSQNSIINCTFEGADIGPVLYLHNAGLLMENNHFSWNDWSTVAGKPCWPQVEGNLLPTQTLADRQPHLCNHHFNFSLAYVSRASLDAGQGTAAHPTIVRRTTVENFGSSSGIFCAKNCDLTLNDVSRPSNPSASGALLDSTGHDLHEFIDDSGLTATWTPSVCSDFNEPPYLSNEEVCIAVGGCQFNGNCSGFPTGIDVLPQEVSDNFT